MSKPAAPRDGITVVIPVYNAADRLDKAVSQWADALARLGREYEIIAMNDGSTDGSAGILSTLAAGRVRHLTVLTHDTHRGFGAALRTALAQARFPLFFYTGLDYPYSPQDLAKLLPRIEIRDAVLGKQADLISGCRTGVAAPAPIAILGKAWRLLCRVILGLQLEPSAAWPGLGGAIYRLVTKFVFANPLADVNSKFKLFRTAFLRRFPIQSDSEFVHTELVAKATFLTSIMDEVPLTPVAAPLPAATRGRDFLRVFNNPEFGFPAGPLPSEPESPAPPPVTTPDAVPDARSPEHPAPPATLRFT